MKMIPQATLHPMPPLHHLPHFLLLFQPHVHHQTAILHNQKTHVKARSEIYSEEQNVRSVDDNNENVNATSLQLRRNIEKVRSEINPQNILQSKRTRKQNKEPNVESLGGQKYLPEFLNLSDKASTPSIGEFQYLHEQQKRKLFQRTIGICFNQMSAKRGIKLYGE